MKVRGDEQSATKSGKLFHVGGPATAKDLSPIDERHVGTTRVDDDADHVNHYNAYKSNVKKTVVMTHHHIDYRKCQSSSSFITPRGSTQNIHKHTEIK